jgi:hypothetical protein
LALLELRRRGIEKPSRHAAVVRNAWVAGTVFSLEPLPPRAISTYELADKDPTKQRAVVYVPGLEKRRENAFTQLATAIDAGKEEEFFSSYVVDARPVTDDSPFFYNFHHLWEPGAYEDSAFARAFDSRIPIAPSILRMVLLQCSLLVVVLVLLPLWMLKRRGLRERGTIRPLVYFTALGAGFMLLEISSIQRLALFLGHPTYSLTVVLFSFLFFAGLGSLCSGRFLKDGVHATRIALAVIAIGIAAFTFGADAVMQRYLHLSLTARIAIALAFLAPINFAMGLPFPRGLALLQRDRPELTPWAIGVNGGASVIASVLATMVAIEAGFTAVALVALGCYVAALLALREPRLAPAASS